MVSIPCSKFIRTTEVVGFLLKLYKGAVTTPIGRPKVKITGSVIFKILPLIETIAVK